MRRRTKGERNVAAGSDHYEMGREQCFAGMLCRTETRSGVANAFPAVTTNIMPQSSKLTCDMPGQLVQGVCSAPHIIHRVGLDTSLRFAAGSKDRVGRER